MAKDNIQKLKKENDDLKSQIGALHNELKELQKKMEANHENDDLRKSVDFLSGEYDDFRVKKRSAEEDLKRFESKLEKITRRVDEIGELIESLVKYSYEYNVKIFGIPQTDEVESAEETVDICCKLFKEMGAEISESDIDIAHRLANRNNSNFPPLIVCKFTRRIAKFKVMDKKKKIKDVDISKIISRVNSEFDSSNLNIFEHLSPMQQDLLKQTKMFKRENNWAYCWVKNQTILLRQTHNSKIFRIDCTNDLERIAAVGPLDANNSFFSLSTQTRGSDVSSRGRGIGRGSNRGGTGRGKRTRSRSRYDQGVY